ncbi:M42 family metallopeptidase [Liberiplasma polymorphum]|jgi:glutamyl aminopeptidase|uniref:M42 family metallopeptidase n=1 Tax=Liberiplasma polymorphum TaxID=3374570 RepID=UPI003770D9F7
MEKRYVDLVNLPGAPSFEKHVKQYMKKEISKFTNDIIEDKLGSIFGVINRDSKGPKVMMAGHMDEVGGLVVGITKQGLVKMIPLGGMKGDVYLSQHMIIYTDDLTEIPGVTASKPPHLTRGQEGNDAPLKFEDLLLDIGADSKEHAEALGVKIGQQVISRNNYVTTNDGKKFISKAWDNRFGCGMALDLLEALKDETLECSLYAGATVQEEVGLRGAATASGLVKPDIFLAVDASPCADSFEGDEISGTLGNGFLVRFYDPNALMHQGMKKYIEEMAKKHDVKFQYYQSKGGTDAARVQLSNEGVVVATIGMPSRYIHSTTSMIHHDDYLAVKKILVELVKSFNTKTYEEIKSNV